MDPKSFPTAASYVAGLAGGLAAHPQCLVKGSVMREIVDSAFAAELRAELPAELEAYFSARPVATAWVPEVHVHALLLATFDRFFGAPGGSGERGFVDWAYRQNLALFDSTLYRVIFFVVSPERLFNGVEKRWATFRRGSKLETLLVEKGHARLRVHYPPGLYTDLLARVRATSFRAAATCAGAEGVEVHIESRGRVETEFVLRWR